MIAQIVNLTMPDVFRQYSRTYKIFRDVYSHGLLGLELRSVSPRIAATIQEIVLFEKEICYKNAGQGENEIDLCIPGTISNFKELSKRILSSGDEHLGYKIVNVIKNFEEYDSKSYVIGGKTFQFNKPYIMGILNVTLDSFSDGGLYINSDSAAAHAINMLNDGADIIDIGGESTRPGAKPLPADEELNRVLPVIQKIITERPGAVISIDTTKSKVAEEALKLGVKIINDISGGTYEPEILDIAKKYDAAFVIMHIRGTPENMQNKTDYEDIVKEIYDYLYARIEAAKKAEVSKLFIDPGIGFGKSVDDNFLLLRRLEDFISLGYPILIGLSRKSFIGKTLNLDVAERDFPTAILETFSIRNKARVIRTHNVKLAKHAASLLTKLI